MWSSVILSLLFISLFSLNGCANAVQKICPHPKDSYPCYCEDDTSGKSIMYCNHLNDSRNFTQALSPLQDFKFSLLVWMSHIKYIKSNAFQGPALDEIEFKNSTFRMAQPPFVGQEKSLKILTFRTCFNKDYPVNSWTFKHLVSLNQIFFHDNDIKVLKNNWLASTGPNLRVLRFEKCQIQKLENKVFSKVIKLTDLSLTNNQISSLSRSMFSRPASSLEEIDLKNNKIFFLPNDIFDDMPRLKSVLLQNNKLRQLSGSVLAPTATKGPIYFGLEGNPIVLRRRSQRSLLPWHSVVPATNQRN